MAIEVMSPTNISNNVKVDITYDIYAIAGGYSFTTLSYLPTHGTSLQSSAGSPSLQAAYFSGGSVGVSATATATFASSGSQTPTAGTVQMVAISGTINGSPDYIIGGFTLQSSPTVSDIATGIKNVYYAIIDPTNNNLPTGGFVQGWRGNSYTATQITSAAQTRFGSDETAAVGASSGTVTFTHVTGSEGNNAEIRTWTLPSLPAPLPTFSGQTPQNVKGLIPLGSTIGLTNEQGTSTIDLFNDNVFNRAALFLGRSNPTFTFQAHEVGVDMLLRGALSSAGGASMSSTARYMLGGQTNSLVRAGLLIVKKGLKIEGGTPDYVLIPNATFTFGNLSNPVAALPQTQVTVAPIFDIGVPVVECINQIYSALSF